MYKNINIFRNINIMETVIEMYNCQIKNLKIIKWWAIGMNLLLGFFTVVNFYIHIPLTVNEEKLMLILQIAGVCIFLWTEREIDRSKRELIKIRLDIEPGDSSKYFEESICFADHKQNKKDGEKECHNWDSTRHPEN